MKLKSKILLCLSLIGVLTIVMSLNVFAVSLSVKASKSKVSPGESFTVTITGSDATGRVNISVSNGSASQSSVWIENSSATVTITAGSSGTVKVSASGELSSNSGEDKVVSDSASVTIEQPSTGNSGSSNSGSSTSSGGSSNSSGSSSTGSTNNQTKKSNVATLSNLGISPNDFSGFKPGKYNYSVTVENTVQQVTVYASTTHNKASWSVSGANVAGVNGKTVKLKEGTNNIYVTVKAEDGTTKKYTIAVTRKSSEGEIIPNVIEDQEFEQVGVTEGLGLKSLAVEGFELTPEFKIDTYEYEILVENEEILALEDLKNILKYEANFENPLIEIQSEAEELKKGENLVYIIVKDSEREVARYTLKVNLKEEEKVIVDTEEPEIEEKEEMPILSKEMIILTGSISLLTVIGIVAIVRLYMVSQRLAIYESGIEFKEINGKKENENFETNEVTENEERENYEGRRAAKRRGGKHRER